MQLVPYVRMLLRDMGWVEPYGSRALGTFTRDSDYDLSLILHEEDDTEDAAYILERVMYALKRGGVGIITVWPNAKTPLVRCTYRHETFDVTLWSSGGVLCTWLLEEVIETNPEMLDVIRTLKQWAKVHDLLGANQGKLSSHGLTVFAIHYLVSVGMLGLAHLDGDPSGRSHYALFEQDEMDYYARNGIHDENLWWVSPARRPYSRHVPSFKFLVRGVLHRLFEALSCEPGQGQVYSITTRAREPQPTKAFLYIEDPISRGNIASNLRFKAREKLSHRLANALIFLSDHKTAATTITEPGYYSRYCQ